ncbi:MAG: PhzF family phenazine biosynthesis protein [Myxococcota bacterium]
MKFYLIDAFTDQRFSGNHCAVFLDADPLPPDVMQTLAREMNLSETAFVLRSDVADFGARYFTPAEEIPLAGHPTLATCRALLEAGCIAPDCRQISIALPAGIVTVDIDGTTLTMTQLPPTFLQTHDPANVMPLFGLGADEAMAPIQTVSTGTPQLMVPVRSLEALRRASMNVPAYLEYKARSDFFSPHLFALGGFSLVGQTAARHFGVPPDTAEDPFTGSATGGMACHLWRHGLISEPSLVAEQGFDMGRPGRAYVEVLGPPERIEGVRVGGAAVKVLEGEFEP